MPAAVRPAAPPCAPLAAALALATPTWAALAPVTVRTLSGTVGGVELGGRLAFRGVPYAEPPVGDLRFRPPQPHAGWAGVLPATDFGPSCPQFTGGCWKTQNASRVSEDCLTLNVLAPAPLTPGKYPVLVYMHSGEFRCGGSNDAESNWLSWATDVVYVSFNYRVAALGFLAAEELRGRHPSGGTGNYGLLDQRRALEWVQENIRAFGGDPGAVTIMGESSGGTSVAYHLTSGGRSATSLFRRAILESPGLTQVKQWDDAATNFRFTLASLAAARSPGCNQSDGYDILRSDLLFSSSPVHHEEPLMPAEDAMRACTRLGPMCVGFSQQGNATMFAAPPGRVIDMENSGGNFTAYMKSGPVAEADRLRCLLSADALKLSLMTLQLPRDDTFETDGWGPVLDGVDLPMPLEERVRRGDVAAGVDVLVGYNLDEGTEFMFETPPLRCNASRAEFESWVSAFLGPGRDPSVVEPLYEPGSLRSPLPDCQDPGKRVPGKPYQPGKKVAGRDAGFFNAAMRMAGDKAIRCPANSLAAARGSLGRAFVYEFQLTPNYTENFGDTSVMGAFHGAEVPFVFGDAFELRTPFEKVLSGVMGCYWRSFVAHGDPGADSCAVAPWPEYSAATGWSVLELGSSTAKPALAARPSELQDRRCAAFRGGASPQLASAFSLAGAGGGASDDAAGAAGAQAGSRAPAAAVLVV